MTPISTPFAGRVRPVWAGPTVSGMFTHTHIRRRCRRLATVAVSLALASIIVTIHPLPCRPWSAQADEHEEHEGRARRQELEPPVEAAFPARELCARQRGVTRRLQPSGRPHRAAAPSRPRASQDAREQRAPRGPGDARAPRRLLARPPRRLRQAGRLDDGPLYRPADGGRRPCRLRAVRRPPHRLGEHRVAVVLPTLTWQAYNLRDDDGDGTGDTWYATLPRPHRRLARPFLDRGVPSHFRRC